MKSAAHNLHGMAEESGMARTIVEYDSDRRKNCLARHALKHIKAGESAAAADTLARSDPAYDAELQGFFDQFSQAQATLKKEEAEKCSWETARSLLARMRETIKTLPGTED
jgi:hypothetical protein